ncbi:fructose-1,6-bisphosphatase-3 [Pseudobutyrivibrio sp. ACV-2]|uniref:fructose-1,6-bisphosphatase n=1 Tax=Pseudobutyrivibrio sp. ACV-2 TaxID=1520801 RepID=UPI000899B662|nr:fructose-1,6-bisphosphatase [Pseudobutyrivibrio sp. ACV-2]SEA95174.1 fructose-1,6-bisphosphatase-3 [Pseudobutyrivibrio sp. ACV-2]
MEKKENQDSYLRILSKQFPNVASTATEIINLQSILSLPKGTEHYLSDIHGEHEQFAHVLKNGSGAVKRKIDEEFGNMLSEKEKRDLATLIYYPEQRIRMIKESAWGTSMDDWYVVMINRLIQVCKAAASKYTRSKVRKSLPKDFAYVIEELITGRRDSRDQEAYFNEIIHTVIRIGKAPELIIALSNAISRFVVDHLHIVGDIYDRGPGPHICMDTLMHYHSVDIQWGNHDVVWMGAATGQLACIATVLRFSARYGNLDILEDGYGINLLPLFKFAMDTYKEDSCDCFALHYREGEYDLANAETDRKMHKAMSIIQFKVEGQLIKKHPEWHMEDRLLLDKMDLTRGVVTIDGKEYELLDKNFPTVNPADPYALSEEEAEVMEKLRNGFINCEKLQEHVRFLYRKGGLYKTYNNNLLFHGCVPLDENGQLKEVELCGKKYKGRALYDTLEQLLRKGYYAIDPVEKQRGMDMLWYTWCHANSPVFGKDKMATFERYFIAEKETHVEKKNPYYTWYDKDETVTMILNEFGLDSPESHIINGHVPVEAKKGELPIKCGGRLIVIDGGFSKAYQPKTGIAGYTLTYNSYGFLLAAHEPFESVEKAVETGSDIHSDTVLVQHVERRKTVADTDNGESIKETIRELENLLEAYRTGRLVEKE